MRALGVLAVGVALASVSVVSFAGDCVTGAEARTDVYDCMDNEMKREDAALNRVYSDLRRKLNDAQRQQVKAIQLTWIKFRDADCDFVASGVAGGSAAPFVQLSCLIDRTRQRRKELELVAYCEEGDLSCPAW